MSTIAIHPKSKIRIEVDFSITTVCERCRRIQPLAHSIEDFTGHDPNFPPHTFAGCLFCNHPYGRYAQPPGGADVPTEPPKARTSAPIAAHQSIPKEAPHHG